MKIPVKELLKIDWTGIVSFDVDKLKSLAKQYDINFGMAPGTLSDVGEVVLSFDSVQGVYIKLINTMYSEALAWFAEWRWHLDTMVRRVEEGSPFDYAIVIDAERREITFSKLS